MKSKILLSLIFSFFIGCGGGGEDTTNTSSNLNEEITESKYGSIRLKPSDTTDRIFRDVISSEGELIATPDKLKLGIENAIAISSDNIEKLSDGSYVIKNIPATTDASITYITDDKGFTLDNIEVKENTQTDIGEVTLRDLFSLNIELNSSVFSNVFVKINDINFTKKVELLDTDISNYSNMLKTASLEINLPQGSHFLTLSDINGNIIISKYIDINESLDIGFNLDDFVFDNTLKGKIIDKNSNPISDVMIYLKPTKDTFLLSLSDENGDFKFEHLPKGIYTIIIQKNGYKPKTIKDVDVSSINDLKNIELQADTKTGAISGYVYFADSDKHAGIDITIQKLDSSFETKQNGSLEDGAFLITDLPPGKYKLLFGKSDDSTYSQVTTQEINVLAGVTTTLETSYILNKKSGIITGDIQLPQDFDDVSRVKVNLKDSNGEIIASSGIIKEGDVYKYTITAPIGENYTLEFIGSDENGNTLITQTKEIKSVEISEIIQEDLVILQYTDPNPPVITSLNVINTDRNLRTFEDNYLVNPGDKLEIEVLANDKDGDIINYSFNSAYGQFLVIKDNKAIYLSPEESGLYSIDIIAQSNEREDVKTINLEVNHYPTISVIDDKFSDKENPLNYEASDIVTIATEVSDVEDENLTIEWTSNVQGLLDTNVSTLKKQLLPGNHIITQRVVDSMGLVTTKEYYINVKPTSMVWLRAPNVDYLKLYDNKLLKTYELQFSIDDLEFKSLNENIAQVDEEGMISSVGIGSTKVIADSDNYEHNVSVRVVDILENQDDDFKLGINEIIQVKVDKEKNISLNPKYYGKYEVVVFDNDDIVDGAYTKANFYINGEKVSSISKEGIFSLDMNDKDANYTIELVRGDVDKSEYIKIGLIGGNDITDNDDNPIDIIRDEDYEFNDIIATSVKVPLSTMIYSDLNKYLFDKTDYFNVDLQKGYYVFMLQTLNSSESDDYLYFELYDNTGNKIVLSNGKTQEHIHSPRENSNIKFYANIKEAGNYKIKFYDSQDKFIKYSFKVIPSIQLGTIQDKITFEPNDFSFNAYTVDSNKTINSEINNILGDKADWYKVHLKKGYYVFDMKTLNTTDSDDYFYFELYDSSNNKVTLSNGKNSVYISSPKNNSESRFYAYIQEEGDYKIKFYDSKNKFVKYSLEIIPSVALGLVQSNITYELNDYIFDAYPIEKNNYITSDVNVLTNDHYDYYSVYLEKGNYDVNVTILPGSYIKSTYYQKLYIYIYNQSDENIYSYSFNKLKINGSKNAKFEIKESGIYKIRIRNYYDDRYYRGDKYYKTYYKLGVLDEN